MRESNAKAEVRKGQLSKRILTRLRPEHFRLPTDKPKKCKHLWRERRSLLMELGQYADRDGTRIEPSVKRTVSDSLGRSPATLFRHLDALKKLGFLLDDGPRRRTGPQPRRLNLERIAEVLDVSATVEALRNLVPIYGYELAATFVNSVAHEVPDGTVPTAQDFLRAARRFFGEHDLETARALLLRFQPRWTGVEMMRISLEVAGCATIDEFCAAMRVTREKMENEEYCRGVLESVEAALRLPDGFEELIAA